MALDIAWRPSCPGRSNESRRLEQQGALTRSPHLGSDEAPGPRTAVSKQRDQNTLFTVPRPLQVVQRFLPLHRVHFLGALPIGMNACPSEVRTSGRPEPPQEMHTPEPLQVVQVFVAIPHTLAILINACN